MFPFSLGILRWFTGKESACQGRRHRRSELDPWVRKMPWKRKWQPMGKFHGQRSLAGYSSWGCKRARCDWARMHTSFSQALRQKHELQNWRGLVYFPPSIPLRKLGLREFMTCPGPHTGLKLRSTASSSNGHYAHGHSKHCLQTSSINSTWKLVRNKPWAHPNLVNQNSLFPRPPSWKIHTLEFEKHHPTQPWPCAKIGQLLSRDSVHHGNWPTQLPLALLLCTGLWNVFMQTQLTTSENRPLPGNK